MRLKTLSIASLALPFLAFSTTVSADPIGDTFTAAMLVQDGTNAFFLDDGSTSFTFGGGAQSAGINNLTGAEMFVDTSISVGPNGGELIEVRYYSGDSSILVPVGALSPNGLPFFNYRIDLGTIGGGSDPIEWDPNPGFSVLSSGFSVYNDGASFGTFSLNLDASTPPFGGVSGVGVAGVGVADIGGFGVDEMRIFWEVEHVPAPGAALLALIGLPAIGWVKRRFA